MIIPDRVVQDQLMISISPIVPDAHIPIYNQTFYSQLLQSGRGSQPALTGAYCLLVSSYTLSASAPLT